MKIIQYCQHVLGIGHFFRTLEISRALKDHDVILVTGGAKVDVALPDHVREIHLPGLMMDSSFNSLFSTEKGITVEQVKEKRQKRLWTLFEAEAPDILIVELYPFGRKAFRFELDPVLRDIQNKTLPRCRVLCSLRDILVEKKDTASYEKRVIATLNRYFDGLLIHADPQIISIESTFTRTDDISVPMAYTGFVTPKPPPGAGRKLRKKLGISDSKKLVVASAGGGKVGGDLLVSVARAFLQLEKDVVLQIFTGPFMEEKTIQHLNTFRSNNIRIERFTSEFLSYLAAADLSVSMAGYNTFMNILTAKVPALVWPFAQNREQRLRAEQMAGCGQITILQDNDLEPSQMAGLISRNLISHKSHQTCEVNLNGAENTANWIKKQWERELP